MSNATTFTPPPMSRFDAASGLLLMLCMGGAYLFGMQGMPDLTDGEAIVAWYHARGALDGEIACALAFVLAPAMLVDKGISTDAIYLMHTASLLTGVTASTTGPAFFIPMAIVAFRTGFLPRWLAWFTVLCAAGSVVPIFGAFALTGPFNVGNGWVGIHAVAASWVGWSGVTSAWFLTQLKRNGA